MGSIVYVALTATFLTLFTLFTLFTFPRTHGGDRTHLLGKDPLTTDTTDVANHDA